MSYEIHSVDFRHNYTAPQARKWLKKHNYKPIKRAHITKKDGAIVSIRYRIQDPALFKSFITKKVDDVFGLLHQAGKKPASIEDMDAAIKQKIR